MYLFKLQYIFVQIVKCIFQIAKCICTLLKYIWPWIGSAPIKLWRIILGTFLAQLQICPRPGWVNNPLLLQHWIFELWRKLRSSWIKLSLSKVCSTVLPGHTGLPPPIVRATDYDQTHSGHRQLAKNGAACWCWWMAINFGRQLLLSKGAALSSLSCPQLSVWWLLRIF